MMVSALPAPGPRLHKQIEVNLQIRASNLPNLEEGTSGEKPEGRRGEARGRAWGL